MSAIQETETEQEEEGKVFQNRTHTADTVCLIKGEQAMKYTLREKSSNYRRGGAVKQPISTSTSAAKHSISCQRERQRVSTQRGEHLSKIEQWVNKHTDTDRGTDQAVMGEMDGWMDGWMDGRKEANMMEEEDRTATDSRCY